MNDRSPTLMRVLYAQKCVFGFGLGFAPDSAGELTALPKSLAGLRAYF